MSKIHPAALATLKGWERYAYRMAQLHGSMEVDYAVVISRNDWFILQKCIEKWQSASLKLYSGPAYWLSTPDVGEEFENARLPYASKEAPIFAPDEVVAGVVVVDTKKQEGGVE